MTAEAGFYKWADELLEKLLQEAPVLATELGDHRWDDRLADHTLEAQERRNREMKEALAELEGMEAAGFSLDGRIDHTLMIQLLKSFVRGHEKLQTHLRDPGEYLQEPLGGVFLLLVREFAPLPQRLKSALGRARETPRVLAEGRGNLRPERVPRVWAEVALEQAQQGTGLFAGLLPALADAVPDIKEELIEASQAAAAAMREYAAFVENEVLPQARGDFAVGRQLFEEMLREDHMVDYDADQLLETGWWLFEETRRQMEEVAREINPAKTVPALLEEAKAEHPTAQGLLTAYQEAMAAARQYVMDHDIVSIPGGESLKVVETPAFLRNVIPYAAYMMPGWLEEMQEGLFLVTPVDPSSSPEEQEQKLKGHFWATLPITALHEAYPGHHLQLVWANTPESTPRKLGFLLSPLFIEGWAFYCEELMEQLGYIAEPIQRLGRLSDQLWRAARIILDVSLHTRGMSVDEAVDFLVKECQLEPTNALAEVRRYTQTPTYPQSYLMGKLAILEIIEDYRRRHPGVTLRELHDAILSCGSLPPRLMRERLFA